MKTKDQLSLRRNEDVVSQQAKQLVKWVMGGLSPDPHSNNYRDTEELAQAGFEGIDYLTVHREVVIDHGWLCYEILMDMPSYAHIGKTLEGLYRSRSNNQIGNRSTYIKTPAQKGRKVYVIEVVLVGYKRNYIVVDRVSGKIIPNQFGELFSPDWDQDHPEAIRHMEANRKDDLFNDMDGHYDDMPVDADEDW